MSNFIKRQRVIFLCGLLLLGICGLKYLPRLVFAGGQSSAAPITTPNGSPQRIPRYQVYEHLLTILDSLDKKADEAKEKGEDEHLYREFYQRAAGLNDHQWKKLLEIVADTKEEVARLDDQARDVITKEREKASKNPNGMPPKRFPVLEELQKRKNHILADVPTKIKEAFGEDEFNRFDKFVRNGLNVDQRGVQKSRPGEGNK